MDGHPAKYAINTERMEDDLRMREFRSYFAAFDARTKWEGAKRQAARNVWCTLSGTLASEMTRLWDKGYTFTPLEIVEELTNNLEDLLHFMYCGEDERFRYYNGCTLFDNKGADNK